MQHLYIMCGLAFSGKSTLAKKVAEFTGSTIIAFDKLWVKKDKEQPVSKDAEGWRFIRKVAQDEITKELRDGNSVVYDDNNVQFQHREELREIARKLGIKETVIYLNTPLEVIREREAANRVTGQRHEVEPENFQTVLEQLQVPTSEENVIEFRPETNLDSWLKGLR